MITSKLHVWSFLSRILLAIIFYNVTSQTYYSDTIGSTQWTVFVIILFNIVFFLKWFDEEGQINTLFHRNAYLALLVILYAWVPFFDKPWALSYSEWHIYAIWSIGAVLISLVLDFAYYSAREAVKLKEHLSYYSQRCERQWTLKANEGCKYAQLELFRLHWNELGLYNYRLAIKPQANSKAIEWLSKAKKNPDKNHDSDLEEMMELARQTIGSNQLDLALSAYNETNKNAEQGVAPNH